MASTGPHDPNRILDYQQPRTREADWRWALLVLAPAPFAIEVILVFHWAGAGDPIGTIALFRAYHYWAGVTIVLTVAWFVWVAITFRWTRQWILMIALAWCLCECWVAVQFVREVHNDTPPGTSWSVWS